MGCSIRCPWCCNPENLTAKIKVGKDGQTYGRMLDEEIIFQEALKDKAYYLDDGGVTFSGGEFLLNINEYFNIINKLRSERIHLCCETALYAPTENVNKALDLFDLMIIDFKIIDTDKSKKVLKADSSLFLNNINKVIESKIPYIARIPLAKEIIEDNNIEAIIEILSKRKPVKVEVFKIHNLAESKYSNLGLDCSYSFELADSRVDSIIKAIRSAGIEVEHIKI